MDQNCPDFAPNLHAEAITNYPSDIKVLDEA